MNNHSTTTDNTTVNNETTPANESTTAALDKERRRTFFWLTLIVLSVLQAIALFFLASKLPNSIPVHFNYKFEVDRWGSPFELLSIVLITPFIFTLKFILNKVYKQNPRNCKIEDNIVIAVGVLIVTVSLWLYSISLRPIDTLKVVIVRFLPSFVHIFLGVFAIILGNYEGTIKPNKTLGIKTKWTLADDENWRKTHRFAAPFTVLAGIVFTLSGILLLFVRRISLYIVPVLLFIILTTVVPTIYSYVLSKQKKNE